MKVHAWLVDFAHCRENCPTGMISGWVRKVTQHNGVIQYSVDSRKIPNVKTRDEVLFFNFKMDLMHITFHFRTTWCCIRLIRSDQIERASVILCPWLWHLRDALSTNASGCLLYSGKLYCLNICWHMAFFRFSSEVNPSSLGISPSPSHCRKTPPF